MNRKYANSKYPDPQVPNGRLLWVFGCLGAWVLTTGVFAQEKKPEEVQRPPISIAEINRTTPVDFEKEILPILKNNCLACHNQTTTKADLVLETPQTIFKGGESGPAVVAAHSADSLLLQLASHQKKPKMPPKDNKVAASDLTAEELGLIKLWIDQGAKGEVRGAGPIVWHPLPEGLNPIYAVALTRDGQHAACGRANQIFIYHLPSGQLVTRLTDPQLMQSASDSKPGLAHRDMVHSLAFSPDGNLLASGAYREVKLWRRPRNKQKFHFASASTNAAQSVSASSDGKWLVTSGADGSIQLFDLATGKPGRLLIGHEQAVNCLKFSPDNQKLASGSADKTIRVWKVSDGALIAQATGPAAVNAVSWIAEGRQLASGGDDQLIRVWQLPEPDKKDMIAVKELKGHEGPVTSLATVAPSDQGIISGSADGSVRQWNIEKGEVIRQIDHGGPVAAVAVRSDGKRFATVGLNCIGKLWNAEDGKPIAELKGDRYAQDLVAETERAVEFAKSEFDYHKTSVQSAESKLKTENDRLTKVTDANTKAEKTFLEKQKAFLAATETKTAAEKKIADLLAEVKKATETFEAADKASKQATEEAKAAIETAAQAKLVAEQAEQNRLDIEKLAADAAVVASKTKGASDKPASDTSEFALKTKAFADSVAAEGAAKAKAAADARTAADKAIDEIGVKAFAAGQIKVKSDQVIAEAPEKQKQATNKLEVAVKAFADAEKEFKKAEIAKVNADHEVQLVNNAVKQSTEAVSNATVALQSAEATQKKIASELAAATMAATDSEKPIRALAFSPDNLTLATAGDDQAIHTWSATTGAPFETFRGHTAAVYAVTFAGAGSLASAAAAQSTTVWDVNAGWTLERVIGTGDSDSPLIDRVNAVGFSPDGQLLATGSGEPTRSGEIKLWHLADGSLAQEFKNVHSDTVFTLDFSPDAKYLASGAADKFAKVSEVASGKVVKSFEGHTHHVLGVSWTRDGRTLASAGADNQIKVWDFITGERKKAAGSGANLLTTGFTKEVTSIRFIGATDHLLVTSGDGQVRAIREKGEDVRAFAGGTDYMYSAAATPDGQLVIAGGQDSVLRVWNGTNGDVLAEYTPPK